MASVEYFEDELKQIKNDQIRHLTVKVLENAPPGFWTDASSSSAKYHPPQSAGHEGLLRHIKSMFRFAVKNCDMYSCTELETDAVLSAVLLHDIAKRGINWGKHTIPTHDVEGYIFVKRVATKLGLLDTPMIEEILQAVLWHYGKWSKRGPEITLKRFPEDYSKVMLIVHQSDVSSADKDIHRYSLEGGSLIG